MAIAKGYWPMFYPVTVADIGQNEGDELPGQAAIKNQPFLLIRITHRIIRAGVPLANLEQDGAYSLDWSLQETQRFFKGDVPNAEAMFGSARTGIWVDLPAPISVDANDTLGAAIKNELQRPAPFTVQVIFHGIEKINPRGGATQ